MKKFKNNNSSSDNVNINILNVKLANNGKMEKIPNFKKIFFNEKIAKIKLNSIKNNNTRNIHDALKIIPSQSCRSLKANFSKNYSMNNESISNSNNKNKSVIEGNKNDFTSNSSYIPFKNEINKRKINKIIMRNNKDNMYTGTNIKKSELEFNKTNYIDKSLKNWEEIKNNFFQHIQNQEIIKKLEKEKLNKRYLNEQRKYYYGQHRIKGMPYYYDISSTYMNNYKNKSEHKRHEILIEELSKLRSYLQEYPNNNNVEIIKDFLITHNIENVDKYTNYQLIQVGKFVCQNDIYKINSLLKPYMNVKNMIYDILENSVTLNNKFSGIKFSDSTDKLLNKINLKYKNNRTLDLENSKLSSRNYSTFEKNKKFYISELDYNNDKTESLINNINRIIEQDNENNNINKTNEIKGEEDNKKEDFRTKEEKDFIAYSKKRKQLLDSIGISIKNSNENNFIKEMYSSPLLKIIKIPLKMILKYIMMNIRLIIKKKLIQLNYLR